MTDAVVAPIARFPCKASVTFPAMTAEGMTLTNTVAYQTYMPHPDGEGDTIWQGNLFGLSAPAGSNVTYAAISVAHSVSSTAAFSSITAQIWAGGVQVGVPQTFTPSVEYITETIVTQAGIPPANVPTLAVQLIHHQTAMGLAYVRDTSAEIAYSFSDSIGIISLASRISFGAPTLTVTTLPVSLVSQGAAAQSFTPLFGQPTAAGNLLLAWVFSNSSSSTPDFTCSDPTWFLLETNGASFGWLSLWFKPVSIANEVAPTFASSATIPMSQLLEFNGASLLDQVGGGVSGASENIVISTASGADTRSGDLVFSIGVWPGAHPTPASIATMTGNDGSGSSLALNTANNAATTGQTPWVTGWAQAGAAAGPAGDTTTGTLSNFDFGRGIIASFRTLSPEVSPALELSGFGLFSAVGPGSIILAVDAVINQYASTSGLSAPSYQLWNGSNAQIGTTQTGSTSTSSAHTDTVLFTGATYSQLPNLVLRVYANQGEATAGAIQYVDSVALSVIYQ